jgi:hypothetical protein
MSAQYRPQFFGQVLVVQAAGTMGVEGFRGLRELLAEHTASGLYKRALVDLRTASVTLDPETLQIATRESIASPFKRIDTGMLVPAWTNQLAWRHCLQMASAGSTRLWFTNVEQALEWAGIARLPEFRGERPMEEGR